jgi:sugar O-acyltransferase (sialic acid O-acetyltransferase NeuD family)
MDKTRKLVVIGDSLFAEIAYEYFTYDSEYEVVAFSVEQNYIKRDSLFGLPVVPFETMQDQYVPPEHSFFAANVYTQMNQLRTRLYRTAKGKGYTPASYISSRAFVWRNVSIGEHCFIFEDNTVQPFARIGNNVVLWSGNHIGHHSTIKDNVFFSSHVVLSGVCVVGESCFMGVNSTIANNITIGNNVLVGAGALIIRDVPNDQKVVGIWKMHSQTGGEFESPTYRR